MSCAAPYAGHEDFAHFWCITVSPDEESHLNRMLTLAATPIHAARAANGGCDCSLASWADTYLMMLNCMLAAATYNCKCSNLTLTTEEKANLLEATREDLTNIRQGNIELCDGETGAEFAVTGWAEQGVTLFSRIDIITNDILRNTEV